VPAGPPVSMWPAGPTPAPFTPLEGVDGVSVPSGAATRAAGKRFVGRYLSTPGNPKNLRSAEAEDFHRHGLGIVLFFETTGTSFTGGHAAGVRDGQLALEGLRALGAPAKNQDGTPVAVYFTIDTDPHGHEAAIVDYVRGAASVLGPGRTGVYGGLGTIDACYRAHACRYFCQAYAWSNNVWHKARHLEQYANGRPFYGHTVDLERQVRPDAGLWLP
jgi:Domain of unknown function (DUF1906)